MLYGLASYHPLEFGNYKYPLWANILGIIITLSSAICIPIFATYQIYIAPGNSIREVSYEIYKI